jgi:hypothetical protein
MAIARQNVLDRTCPLSGQSGRGAPYARCGTRLTARSKSRLAFNYAEEITTSMSAFGGKADMAYCTANVRL